MDADEDTDVGEDDDEGNVHIGEEDTEKSWIQSSLQERKVVLRTRFLKRVVSV